MRHDHATTIDGQGSGPDIVQRGRTARVVCDSKRPRGKGPGSGEEDDLCFCRVEDEATGGPPGHKAVNSVLNPFQEDPRVRATTENCTVVGKGNTKSGAIIDELNGLVEGEGPEGCRTDASLRETHSRSTGRLV